MNNSLFALLLCLFAFAAASDCVGRFDDWLACDGPVCGGQSEQIRFYTVQIPATYGGAACPHPDKYVERRPCTVLCSHNDCVGAWDAPTPCVSNGVCGSDAGKNSRTYRHTTPQGPGGAPCAIADGTVEQLTCSAPVTPCKACEGSFGAWSACTSTATKCGDDSGEQTRTYKITQAAEAGGAACPFVDGYVQKQRCAATAVPCKGCVGSFGAYTPCVSNGVCDSDAGTYSRTYKITEPGEAGGAVCPHADGYVSVERCSAPVRACQHCVGSWSEYTNCVSDGKCGSSAGKRSRTYTITTPAGPEPGSRACPATDGFVEVSACAAPITPCRGCVGSWGEYSACVSDGVCSSDAGKKTRTYKVTDPGEAGGARCEANDGYVQTTKCSAPITPCAPEDGEGGFGAFGACKATGCGTTEGTQSRTYTVTKQPKFGGKPTPYVNGYVETVSCEAAAYPCPVDCVGSFTDGECVSDGVCSSSAGKIKSTYSITTQAANNGKACPYKHGYVKTTKCNTAPITPCPPRDCVGSWTYGTCKARGCGSSAGDRTGTYKVTVTAAYGGKSCEANNGQTKTEECVAENVPCPVHCIGAFSEYSTCASKGVCSSPAGTRTRTYTISQAAAFGGNQCNHKHAEVETSDCNDAPVTPCPPEPCVAKWSAAPCVQTKCGDAAGTQVETFSVEKPARYEGTCEAKHGDTRTVACTVKEPRGCPVNCVGKYSEFTECKPSAKCGTTSGTRTRRYSITTAAAWGGIKCPRADGSDEVEECVVPNVPCPPEDCTGFLEEAPCVQNACHDKEGSAPGTQSQVYRITKDSKYGGKSCPYKHNEVVKKACEVPAKDVKRCPIDCVGHWAEPTECKAIEPCGCPKGTQTANFVVTREAQFGGKTCFSKHGEHKTTPCLVPAKKVARCPNELLDAPCEDLTALLADVKNTRCVLEALVNAIEKKK